MRLPFTLFTESPEQTEEIGRTLASLLVSDNKLPTFVAMYGDLGVGKTAFVRGFCSELCKGATVKSPTFALVNEYRCVADNAPLKKVCHLDMYRITDEDDLYSIGFYDYLNDNAYCIAEWCELIPYALPEEYVSVKIEKTGLEDQRRITVELML